MIKLFELLSLIQDIRFELGISARLSTLRALGTFEDFSAARNIFLSDYPGLAFLVCVNPEQGGGAL